MDELNGENDSSEKDKAFTAPGDTEKVEGNVQELEPKPAVVLLYRENDLYTNYLKLLKGVFEGQGREVEVITFPREMSVEEIEAQKKDLQGKLEGKEVLFDMTSKGIVPSQSSLGYHTDNLRDGLDRIFEKASAEIVSGETFEEQLEKAMTNVFSNPENNFSRVVIVDKQMLDHQFYDTLIRDELVKQFGEEVYSANDPFDFKKEDPVIAQTIDKTRRELSMSEEMWAKASEKLRDILIASGCPAEKIVIEHFRSPSDWSSQQYGREDLIISDRHVFPENDDFHGTYLRLPMMDLLRDANAQGLMSFSDDEFSKGLKTVLEQREHKLEAQKAKYKSR